MNKSLIDRLKKELNEIIDKIKQTSNLDLDSQIELLENQGYTYASSYPLCFYGDEHKIEDMSFTPFVKHHHHNNNKSTRHVELMHSFRPEYPIDTLVKPKGTTLTEFQRAKREYEHEINIYDRFGLHLETKNNQIKLSYATPFESLEQGEISFKKLIKQAKQYLEQSRYSGQKRI